MKSGFLTLKSNLSTLQVKNGLKADFLLIMKNNYQKKEKRNLSVMAYKYLTFGAGDLKEMFSSGSGVVYNPEKFVILDSCEKALDVDQGETIKAIQNIDRTSKVYKTNSGKKASSPPISVSISESDSDSNAESPSSSESAPSPGYIQHKRSSS